jgi:hypothetical protein
MLALQPDILSFCRKDKVKPMAPFISFLTNNMVSLQLGSQAMMVGQVISYSVLTAKMVNHEACKILRYNRKYKPIIIERRKLNYPDVRLDINGLHRFNGDVKTTIH